MNLTNLVVIVLTVLLSAIAQLLLKIGVTNSTGGEKIGGMADLLKLFFSLPVMGGVTIYGLSVLVWLWVLSRVPLSIAYPFVGLSFIFTLIFGYFILGENVNAWRIFGTLLIACGCMFVARS